MRAYLALLWIIAGWAALLPWNRGPGELSPDPLSGRGRGPQVEQAKLRNEAVRLLEDLVQRERFYQQRTGSFTWIPGRLDFQVPESVRSQLDIHVVEATRDRLLVRAVAGFPERRIGGQPEGFDQIWMDESYRIQSNFEVLSRFSPGAPRTNTTIPELEVEQVDGWASTSSH